MVRVDVRRAATAAALRRPDCVKRDDSMVLGATVVADKEKKIVETTHYTLEVEVTVAILSSRTLLGLRPTRQAAHHRRSTSHRRSSSNFRRLMAPRELRLRHSSGILIGGKYVLYDTKEGRAKIIQ